MLDRVGEVVDQPGTAAGAARRGGRHRHRPGSAQHPATHRAGGLRAGRRPVRRARRDRPGPDCCTTSSSHGITPEQHAQIGDLPHGRGVLGLLIDDPRPLRMPDITQHPRSYGFPAEPPADAQLPRRAGPHPRPGLRQPLPGREAGRRAVHRRRRGDRRRARRRRRRGDRERPAVRAGAPAATLARRHRRDHRGAARRGTPHRRAGAGRPPRPRGRRGRAGAGAALRRATTEQLHRRGRRRRRPAGPTRSSARSCRPPTPASARPSPRAGTHQVDDLAHAAPWPALLHTGPAMVSRWPPPTPCTAC